jgi:methoxymalonate biosynthesis acyl carrier protein
MIGETKAGIRRFINERYPRVSINDSDDIFSLGIVSSLFAMELVVFVETEFNLTVPHDELRMANFRSVDAMSELVNRVTGAAARDSGQVLI